MYVERERERETLIFLKDKSKIQQAILLIYASRDITGIFWLL